MSDILDKARRVLKLDSAATPAPWEVRGRESGWSLNYRPKPRTVVHVATVDVDRADIDLIAESRTAAPDLARFALLVDEVTMRAIVDNADVSDDSPEAEYRACAVDLRRRLSLPCVTTVLKEGVVHVYVKGKGWPTSPKDDRP